MALAPSRWTRLRIFLCGVALVGMGVWVARRAFELQVRERERLADLAEDNSLRDIDIPPRRGRILDRNGKELASTVEVDSIFVNPRVLAGVPDAEPQLARALHMDRRELHARLEGHKFFAWLKRRVTPEESAAVKDLALPSIGFRREPRRFYPLRTLGATVLGHAGGDGRGLEGVELAFDETLRGSSTTVQGIKDALGRDILIDGVTDTTQGAGKDLVLALDSYLTLVTESALADVVEKQHARAATSVMMDARTGEVLAMASVPTYNPNDPKTAIGVGARDRAITDSIEPGSTMKTFTFAAVLDAGKVRTDDRFDCQMGHMLVGKHVIRDSHPLGVLTAAEAFQHSSNICTVKIARRIGKDALAEALDRFGIGHPTGIGLPGERSGVLRPVSKWGEIGFANIAFGQGVTVTPLQLVAGYAAIASGGVYHPPRLGLRVVNPDGGEEALPLPPHARPEARVMSESAARTLLGVMRRVTEQGGTAPLAAIPGYLVAGKTGTAQKVHNGRYDPDRWIASFIGVVPAESPRLVIAVIVDEPRPVHLGGQVAAPAFHIIAEAALKYLSVPATQPIVVATAHPTSVPVAVDADDGTSGPGTDEVTEPAGDDATEGDGALATDGDDDDNEHSGADMVAVPDFSGMSIGQAVRAARRAGVEIAPEGSGIAFEQKPPSRAAPRGTRFLVSFRPPSGGGT